MVETPSTRTSPHDGDLTDRVLAGRYRFTRVIASGGMATVWEGTDQVLARKVAIKVLHPHLARDESFVRRFRGEAIAAAPLAHPTIVSVYDTVSEDGIDAIVMELVSGTTLRADLDQHGPLRLGAVLAIGAQVADALGAAHASGLVHRDVKPANILLSADGRVLVADFGIAKAAEGGDLTMDGSMIGTAKYLAPEQVQGTTVDARTDLYALGIVLYEALSGTVPFVGENDTATALARLHRDPLPVHQLRPEVPPAVDAVVARSLARDPAARFQTAADLRRALVAAGADPGRAPAVAQAAVAAATVLPLAHPTPSSPPAPSPSAPDPFVVPAGGTPPTSSGSTGNSRRWTGPFVVLLALIAVAATVTWLATTRTRQAAGQPATIASFSTFDPLGDRTEKDDLLGNLTDADPTSGWRTETYGTKGIGATKDGVGLVVTLASHTQHLRRLDVATPVGGWKATVHTTGDALPTDVDGWGPAVGILTPDRAGTVTVDLRGRAGRRILIWFTQTSVDGTARIDRVEVRAQ